MDEPEHLSDPELLYSLRLDYLRALQAEDYHGIETTIIPRFWERFAKYYEQYEQSWKDPSVSRLPISLVIDPAAKRRAELEWIELVLNGQLDLFA